MVRTRTRTKEQNQSSVAVSTAATTAAASTTTSSATSSARVQQQQQQPQQQPPLPLPPPPPQSQQSSQPPPIKHGQKRSRACTPDIASNSAPMSGVSSTTTVSSVRPTVTTSATNMSAHDSSPSPDSGSEVDPASCERRSTPLPRQSASPAPKKVGLLYLSLEYIRSW